MRYDDWPSRLTKALIIAKDKGFVWGESDCCLFSCDIVKAITGVDYGASFRGIYTTKRGAALALRNFGGGGLINTVNLIMGEGKSPKRASRGDFVLASQGHGDMLGICIGEAAVFISEGGLVHIELKDCKLAWGID